MTSKLHALILAGGSGTRLWPWSRSHRPKQLLPLVGDASMLQHTVRRLQGLVPPERVWVLTNARYVDAVRAQLPDTPAEQIVGEPEALGNAAAVGLGAALLAAHDPEATMAVLTADHLIAPVESFHQAMERALSAAAADRLVTFGIAPTHPATAFGYIELGTALPGVGQEPPVPREVLRFVEKPDADTAQRYVDSGRFVWNSGMFVWRVSAIWEAYELHLPQTFEILEALRDGAARGRLHEELDDLWARIPDRTTIDYAIMEPSERVACVPARFEWADLGSWAALGAARSAEAGSQGTVVVHAGEDTAGGAHVGVDTERCLVFPGGGRLVATLGLQDMVVVDTGDVLLVMPRERADEAKRLVEAVQQAGHGHLT